VGRPQTLWVGVGAGREALEALAAGTERACEGHGFPREARPFHAHLTLGRVQSPVGREALAAGLRADAAQLAQVTRTIEDAVMAVRLLPASAVFAPFQRMVRDLGRTHGKDVRLVVEGGETEIDRKILDELRDPLMHLLRNAVHHGIEPPAERERAGKPRRGAIEVTAEQRGALVEVTVDDDGRGVPAHVLAEAGEGRSLADVLTRPGFSTADAVTGVAGRGVGLDAVAREVEAVGGRLEVASRPGDGTRVSLLLPLTLALLDAMLVERGGQPFALPLASVLEVLRVEATLALGGRESVALRGEPIPLVDLAQAVGAGAAAPPSAPPALVVAATRGRLALVCDRLLGEQRVVVKPLGTLMARVRGYLGAAILGDGRIALILDAAALDREAAGRAAPTPQAEPAAAEAREPPTAPTILVVEDSFTVRELQRSILEAAGYRVETARDGAEGWQRVRRDGDIALVVTDVEMPHMDGFALVEAIRADAEHAALPVVIVTARGDDADRRRGLDAGADAYIAKGAFEQQALLDTVERLIGR
jgi:two-component system chemotaxis sensor kinase CheA